VLRLSKIVWPCLLILACGACDARARRERVQLARFPTGEIFEDGVSPGSVDDRDRPEDLRVLAPVLGRGVCVPVAVVRSDGARDALRNGVWTYEYVNAGRETRADGQVLTHYTDIEKSSLGLEAQGEYFQNRRIGIWTFWYPDGSLRAKGTFVDDTQAGTWEFRRADGSIDRERTGDYSRGTRVQVGR
jgi:hypothetical protein